MANHATVRAEAPAHGPGHASVQTYVKIAVILTVITALEVWVYYLQALRPVLIPTLLVLSATKFSLVVMFYMHLKYDARLFSFFFVAGLLIAGSIMISFIALFKGLF